MNVLIARAARLPRRRQTGFRSASGFEEALRELSAQGVTGVLAGEAGSVHLADGAVVDAESPFAAEPDALPGERELCRLTALLDAAFFALPQERGRFAFRAGRPPRPVARHPLSVDALRQAVGRRRALLDRVWPRPDLDGAAVIRCPQPVRRTASQDAVLEAADGRRTPPEIARLLGRSTFSTLLDIRQLAAAGLIAAPPQPARPAPVPPSQARVRAPTEASHDLSDPEVVLLLRLRAALETRL